jgi:phosphoglycerate dehydrogenase-like enzyme
MIDSFHPGAITLANQYFNVISPDDKEIHNWRDNAELLLVKGSYVTAADFKSAAKLKAIGKQGVGLDKIDLTAAKVAGVEVYNTPGANAGAVAEVVLALTMSVAREIGSISARQHAGEVVPKSICSGLSISGKTVGLIGMGNIARKVAQIFQGGLSANIVAYDPFLPPGAWDDIPHRRVETVEEVLRAADVVSVHVPLNEHTRDLIGLEQLRMCKRTAIVINAARGGIINEEDLAVALEEGLIWGAGIDCHEQEPPTMERYERLWSHPRVVSTPHIGAATSQAQEDTAKAAVHAVYDYYQRSVVKR